MTDLVTAAFRFALEREVPQRLALAAGEWLAKPLRYYVDDDLDSLFRLILDQVGLRPNQAYKVRGQVHAGQSVNDAVALVASELAGSSETGDQT